jgi:hypothetical protein
MLPGECVGTTVTDCSECGETLSLKVCKSAAGHYLGFFCKNDGPYSRESGYFVDEDAAKWALISGAYGR